MALKYTNKLYFASNSKPAHWVWLKHYKYDNDTENGSDGGNNYCGNYNDDNNNDDYI